MVLIIDLRDFYPVGRIVIEVMEFWKFEGNCEKIIDLCVCTSR